MVGGAAMAAAMIGAAETPGARADTPDDVIGQAITELNQGNVIVDAASTADLSARQADILATQEGFSTQVDPLLNQLVSLQDSLPATGQNFLGGVDEQLVTAAQNVVSADQAFVSADQAGDLSSNNFLPVDLTILEADLGVPGAALYADFASLFALFDPGIATLSAASAAAVTDTTPTGLLSDATTNYTDASQLLSELPTSIYGQYAPALASAIQFDGNMLQGIANLGSAETALSSYDNGVLSEFLNPLFTSVDQSWDQASETALTADQAVQSVVGTGSTADIAAALIGISGPEYEALGPAIQAEFIDLGAHFLTGGDFSSIGDLASGTDPASAIDPSMFADLLSSIGL
jgi:hypothetical protein